MAQIMLIDARTVGAFTAPALARFLGLHRRICEVSRHVMQTRITSVLRPLFLLLTVALLHVAGRSAWGMELSPAELQNPRCLTCHGRQTINGLSMEERRSMVSGEIPASAAQIGRAHV